MLVAQVLQDLENLRMGQHNGQTPMRCGLVVIQPFKLNSKELCEQINQ
jgi:hypothetical protein